jgi:IS30 family transposase
MTTETKQIILRLKREGYAHRKIAEIIGRDHSTITKFLKRYDERIDPQLYTVKIFDILMTVNYIKYKEKLDVSIIDF